MYEATITTASRELTRREKTIMKNLSAATNIGDMVKDGNTRIVNPILWAKVHIVNDKSSTGEYDNLVIMDVAGNLYRTGSESYENSFCNIFEDMFDAEDYEEFTVEAYKQPSRNNQGEMLLCKLI